MSIQGCCEFAPVDLSDRAESAALFRALADPHRLAILATLARAGGEVCVCDFTAALPLNQPTVSHHLKILRDAGLVAGERRGTWVYYRLSAGAATRVCAAVDTVFSAGVVA